MDRLTEIRVNTTESRFATCLNRLLQQTAKSRSQVKRRAKNKDIPNPHMTAPAACPAAAPVGV
jgi:hypothetical protein